MVVSGADLMKAENWVEGLSFLPREVTAYFPKADLQTISLCSGKWLHLKYHPKRQLKWLKCLPIIINLFMLHLVEAVVWLMKKSLFTCWWFSNMPFSGTWVLCKYWYIADIKLSLGLMQNSWLLFVEWRWMNEALKDFRFASMDQSFRICHLPFYLFHQWNII